MNRPAYPRRPALRWLTSLVVVILALAGAGALYERAAEARDRTAFPAPGRLVAVGNHQLHLYCTGAGSPTVVLEAGAGDPSLVWSGVQPEIARTNRVCSYDRAGYGWSEPGPAPRSTHQMAAELDTLLANAGETGPYVLVGHSLGGLVAMVYAREYPAQSVGLVLVDSFNPMALVELSPILRKLALNVPLVETGACRALATIGATRLLFGWGVWRWPEAVAKVPAEARPAAQAHALRAQTCATLFAEQAAVEAGLDELPGPGALGDLPLSVIAATGTEQQAALAALSSRGQLIQAEASGHYVHLDQPELVVEAIRRLAEVARRTD